MNKIIISSLLSILLLLASCKTQQTNTDKTQAQVTSNSDEFLIVDCLLPGQLRKLGQSANYLTARRPVKTSASDCEIRGGEYVAYDRANYSTALKIWLPKAKEGDAEAQAYVGEIYEKGLGLEADYSLAIYWYLKAAQQGNTRSQLNLGYLYEKGFGVKADKSKAMEWYRKASGLEEKNLAYTYTAETISTQDSEVQILKAELSTSRNEANRLKSQLQKTQQKMRLNQQKILLSQSELKETKLQNTNHDTKQNLNELIKTKELKIAEQKQLNQQLEKQYKDDVYNLELKLSNTEKRARQLQDNLFRNQSEKNEKQAQLLDIQAQLANKEKQLLRFNNKNLKEQNKINNVQLNQAQELKLQIEVEKLQLQSIQKKLASFEHEKKLQQLTIQQLNSNNNQFKKKTEQLNKKLANNNVSQTEIIKTKSKLLKQKEAALQAQEKLLASHNKIQLIEKQYKTQEEIYNVKLKKLESEKIRFETLYADSFKQSHNDQKKIEQLIQQKKQYWNQQKTLVTKLNKEKQQLVKQLSALKETIKKEKSFEKPTIEILDPVFAQLRGVPTVTLRSIVKQRQITGKVSSNTEILSLTVNDKNSVLDQQGLFKSNIPLLETETPVNISVIDKNGMKATIDFFISLDKVKKRTASAKKEFKKEINDPIKWDSINFGDYHAIIIANNEYTKLPSLATPINDATVIEQILRKQYGFKTTVLQNATRYETLSLLNEYRSKLSENDNLLIYYAGHGELDRVNMRGHWLPIDSDADNTANWISTIALTDIFNSMSVKHLMVVADSCYSGAMTRSSLARLDAGKTTKQKEQWLKAMLKARSRTILSSGGLKPVLDGGGGNHSVFAKAFIDSLKNNSHLLEGQQLYRKVSTKIVAIAADYGVEQVPRYAPIRHAGHEAGEFFFVPK